jgi:hypothetical protein
MNHINGSFSAHAKLLFDFGDNVLLRVEKVLELKSISRSNEQHPANEASLFFIHPNVTRL